jgi:four helix bundle protein
MPARQNIQYDFEKLEVYQEAYQLTRDVYRATRQFPSEELYGIVSQLRRSTMSIALNIAEGKGRYHARVFVQFLYQSRGSLTETIALIKLSEDLGFLAGDSAEGLLVRANKISAYLNNLIRAISRMSGAR